MHKANSPEVLAVEIVAVVEEVERQWLTVWNRE